MTRDGHRRRGGRTSTRGQTLHDYIAGISVFVLTITVVLGLLPGILAPYQSSGNAADATKVERIGDRLVSNLSTASAPNVIDADEFSRVMAKNDSQLQTRFGLEEYQNVNVTVWSLNGSEVVENTTGYPLTAGANSVGNDATSAARVISLSDPNPPASCRPACRLVVEVW